MKIPSNLIITATSYEKTKTTMVLKNIKKSTLQSQNSGMTLHIQKLLFFWSKSHTWKSIINKITNPNDRKTSIFFDFLNSWSQRKLLSPQLKIEPQDVVKSRKARDINKHIWHPTPKRDAWGCRKIKKVKDSYNQMIKTCSPNIIFN